jgi:hypothetical protein
MTLSHDRRTVLAVAARQARALSVASPPGLPVEDAMRSELPLDKGEPHVPHR